MRIRNLLAIIVFLSSLPLTAQTRLPVTGWYDGDFSVNDGVSHGSMVSQDGQLVPKGFAGVGPVFKDWLTLTETAKNWPSILTATPIETPSSLYRCGTSGGLYTGSVLPITDPQSDTALYAFGGSMNQCCKPYPGDEVEPQFSRHGLMQDPLGAVARYADGNYDAQPYLLYTDNIGVWPYDPNPNSRFNLVPPDAMDYIRGNGPFSAVVRGPEFTPTYYMFFGVTEEKQDRGRGPHMVGVARSTVTFQPNESGTPHAWAATFDFQNNRWHDNSSPNYTNLQASGVHIDVFRPCIFDAEYTTCRSETIVGGDITPIFARIAQRDSPAGCDPSSTYGCKAGRFAAMTGMYVDGYFYLFIEFTEGGAGAMRIAYDASQDNRLRRTATGAIDVELWYRDAAYPQGAYRAIRSDLPIRFSDDLGGGSNPAVPIANAILSDTGSNASTPTMAARWPAGFFPYPTTGTPQSYWLTTTPSFTSGDLAVHQLRYDATNNANPWTISTPYSVKYDGSCANCGSAVGAYTRPPRYAAADGNNSAFVYPFSPGVAIGYMQVSIKNGYTDCGGTVSADSATTTTGLLPFSVSNADFSILTGCQYSVSQPSVSLSSVATQISINVSTTSSCAWQGASQVSWATLPSTATSGTGSTTVTLAANTGPARSGFINVAGRQIAITQAAGQASCVVTLSSTSMLLTASGGAGTVTVTASGCSWSAVSDSAWLTVTSAAGASPVTFSAAASSLSATRTGTLSIGDKTYTVTQYGNTAPRLRGDFNGDGQPDLLWRNATTGQNRIWLMSYATLSSVATLPTTAVLDWKVGGVGDMNGDGYQDIVLHNPTTGGNAVWLMHDASYVGSTGLTSWNDADWQIVSVFDLGSDGKYDLLWHNDSSGDTTAWQMNGTTQTGTITYTKVNDTHWRLAGTADLRLLNQPDLFWHNAGSGGSGALAEWFMSGSAISSTTVLPQTVATSWRASALASYNGDSVPDVVWQNTADGSLVVWYLSSGGTLWYSGTISGNADPAWSVVGPR